MKGIILAAGKGTRLYPMTKPVCKPLLPIYDKPLLYYPLEVLMKAEITDILIIIPPGEEKSFSELLGDGSRLGLSISYREQKVPKGIADAFLVGEDFIGTDGVCLILGDNIFYAPDFDRLLLEEKRKHQYASVFGYWVEDPRPFGVVEVNAEGYAVSIEEKPAVPRSNYIVPGLYFYDNDVVAKAKTLQPSARGELEITDINRLYMQEEKLSVCPLPREFTWFDAGTADSLLYAANSIKKMQDSGIFVGVLERIAWEKGYINEECLKQSCQEYENTQYGKYIRSLLQREKGR